MIYGGTNIFEFERVVREFMEKNLSTKVYITEKADYNQTFADYEAIVADSVDFERFQSKPCFIKYFTLAKVTSTRGLGRDLAQQLGYLQYSKNYQKQPFLPLTTVYGIVKEDLEK